MNIVVAGQHMSVGEALQTYTSDRLTGVIAKYFEHATSANVHFIKESYLFKCDIVVHDGTGRHTIIKSTALCDDAYSSFDMALAKCEKQLRRYKSKLKDRHHRVKISEANFDATKYVIQAQRDDDKIEVDYGSPVIVAETPIRIEQLSVSDAVMKMDLESLPAVMFKNTKNGRMNVVYYRADGNISWVDSANVG